MTTGGGSVSTELTRDEIRETVLHAFGVRLCRWQLEAVVYQLQGRHVVAIAPTGLGKTLPFIVPLLFQRNLLLIIITPLNLLGTQQRRKLESLNIPAIALNAQTLTPEAVKVRQCVV